MDDRQGRVIRIVRRGQRDNPVGGAADVHPADLRALTTRDVRHALKDAAPDDLIAVYWRTTGEVYPAEWVGRIVRISTGRSGAPTFHVVYNASRWHDDADVPYDLWRGVDPPRVRPPGKRKPHRAGSPIRVPVPLLLHACHCRSCCSPCRAPRVTKF